MRKVTYLLLLLLVTMASCTEEEMTPSQLMDKEGSGVVLIINEFYYQLRLSSGEMLYFKGLDQDGDPDGLTNDLEEIKKNKNIATGTGFFVDDNGGILTNRHVVEPVFDKAEMRQSFRNLIKSFKAYYESLAELAADDYRNLERSKYEHVTYNTWTEEYEIDETAINEINAQQEECESAYHSYMAIAEELGNNLDPEGYDITPVCKLGIVYNDTYVNSVEDFIPCTLVRTSEDESTDLALISTNDKSTPNKCHIFTTPDRRPTETGFMAGIKSLINSFLGKKTDPKVLEIGHELHMIGYNAGPAIATTQGGIKAQLTSGRVTQHPDGNRVLYDIATMQGSSGSPVVDNYGNLIAVNFAKMNGSDNFNFGIPLQKINLFMGWK